MPHDVSTQWNLTYNMLKFAYTCCEAIDKITEDHAMKLRNKLGYVKLSDLEAAAALPDSKKDETWSDNEWGVIGA